MRVRLLVMCAALLLAGCGQQELYSKLSEQQANEMISVLQSAGIEAEKTTADGETWSIATQHETFATAIDTLKEQGYPRDDYADIGKVFKKDGFVASPLEERARLNYSLSQDLSHTLSTIDGVLVARVHLAMPEADPLSDVQKPSSASVFIKYRSGADMSKHVGQIKALVVNSIEGLKYENVTVVTFASQPWPSKVINTRPSQQLAVLTWISIPVILLLLGYAGTVAWLQWRKKRLVALLPRIRS